ncbi:[NiFe]-hydrogenase assembly chaperone HybE [Bradyrhizobium sp.]|uniref:[NiFe]-hydrogenase assembly chaperone HybE n=1 Tax=Bradyrhizobium sp. TaxID=376 RepID=UPI003C3BD868
MDRAAEFASLLEDCYRRIGERSMRDLPVYNDALAVEAVGFRADGEALSGILITPWFMNLVLRPLDGSPASWSPGSSISHAFPVGAIDFNVGDVDGIGRIASCSLFSPMFEFSTMEQARATAEAALMEILLPPAEPERPATKLAAAVDRRRFLRGELAEPRP